MHDWMEQVVAQYLPSKRKDTENTQGTETEEETANSVETATQDLVFKNVNILNIVVDGTSEVDQATFALPRSRALLEYRSQMGNSKVFNFPRYISGGIGDSNEIALTSGCLLVPKSSTVDSSFIEYDRSGESAIICDSSVKQTSTQEQTDESVWIWNKFQRYGFVTLWGDEESHKKSNGAPGYGIGKGVTGFFNKKQGATNDHIYGIHTGERYFVPKCYGEKQLHNDSFSYISSFWSNYNQVGRMAMVHLKSSADLDLSLSTFLDSFTQEYSDTIINIIGNPATILDKKNSIKKQGTSLLTTVVPSLVLDSFPWIQKALQINEDKKVTSFDFYTSFASLPSVIMGAYSQNSHARSQALLQLRMQSSWSYNLFTQEIPASRSCKDARIPLTMCQD